MPPRRNRHRSALPAANASGFFAFHRNIQHFNNLHQQQSGGGAAVASASSSTSSSSTAPRVVERNELIIIEEISAWNGVAVMVKISPREGSTVNASWPIWLTAVFGEVDHQIRERLTSRRAQKIWIELQVLYRGHKSNYSGNTRVSDAVKEEQLTKQVFMLGNGFVVLKA